MFFTQALAEQVLIELWGKNDYATGHGPITVYRCEDCGEFHLTSKGTMNERLTEAIKAGRVKRQREADRWENKLKKK